jgi:hypothetical protein
MTSWLPARESTAIGWRRSSSSAASIVRLSMSSGCPASAKCSCNRGCWNGRGARAQASRPGKWSIWKSVRARAPVVGSSATSTAAAASIRLTRGVAPAPTQGHPAVRQTWHPKECRRSNAVAPAPRRGFSPPRSKQSPACVCQLPIPRFRKNRTSIPRVHRASRAATGRRGMSTARRCP